MESGSRAIDERRGAADGWTATDGLARDRRRVSRVSSRSSLSRDAVGRRLLVAADVSAAAIALLIFVPLLGDDTLALTTLAGLPIVVLMSKLRGLYDRDDLLLRKTTLEEVPSLFGLATVYALVIWLLESVLIAGQFGKVQIVGLWLGMFVAMVATRAFARAATRWILPPERCLVLGDKESAERIRERLRQSNNIDATVCAAMPLVPRRTEDAKIGVSAWTVDEVDEVARKFGAHRIVVAPDHAEGEAMLDLVRLAKESDLKMTILPRVLEVVGSEIEPDDLDGMTVLAVRHATLSRSSGALKRGFDLIGAGLALLVLAPLMVLLAIAIRLDSQGPAFFRQTRVGRKGKPFEMLKFRTMNASADQEKDELNSLNEAKAGLFKISDDPRVTRVGRFLRRTSLDELPQLLNVLKGQMSLVGPRPLIHEEDELIQGWGRGRLDLVPGVTGPWQLLGPRRVSLDEMVKIDYIYVGRWSVWADIKIMLRTILHAVGLRGS
jgi:exopolysaccharide biosynthesis polyprenyl glycosylphosphotransferase